MSRMLIFVRSHVVLEVLREMDDGQDGAKCGDVLLLLLGSE